MAVTLEEFAFACFGKKRNEAARRALRQEGEGVSRAGLVAASQWDGLTDDTMERADLQRLLDASAQQVEKYAPDAPDVVKDEATIRLGAFLWDQPANPIGRSSVAAFRSSGAASALGPWVRRPAVVLG